MARRRRGSLPTVTAGTLVPKLTVTNCVNGNTSCSAANGRTSTAATPNGLAHFHAICQTPEDAGDEVRSVAVLGGFAGVRRRHNFAVAAEAALEHTRHGWYPRYAGLYQEKPAELIRSGPEIDDERQKATAGREKPRDELMTLMDEHRLDLWISPSAPGAAPAGLESTGSPVMSLPWTPSGLPTVYVPAGTNQAGLPLGLQLAGRFGADEALLAGGIEEVVP